MRLQDVRIRNFRSIENQDLSLGDLTVLFGKNDSGKSNVVKALEFAFDRSRQVDISNVYISSSHPEPKETTLTVDVRFVGSMKTDTQWLLTFSEDPFNTDGGGFISLSFRTEAIYNPETRTFEKTRSIIKDWSSEEVGGRLPTGLLDSIDFIMLDAHRDIAEVVRDRYSRWNQEVRKADISDEDAEKIESGLAELGARIVNASPFLTAAQDDLKGATDHPASNVEIAPVARSLNELYRSLDVLVTESSGPSISVAQFGAGTRSRAEFMAFKALVDIARRDAEKSGLPYYCLAVFEEPEAHIHPQSQQQLLMELEKLGSQRVVTTHSPYLLSKAPMSSLIHVKREKENTTLTPMTVDLTDEQKKATERYLLRTHGELLFADIVVFAEGETEEQVLPIYFKRHFKHEPFELGVSIATCGGNNYAPFIRIANKLGIPWFILSDAEEKTLKKVKSQLSTALDDDNLSLEQYPQVITCGLGNDYEAELISDGYSHEMLKAIKRYDDREKAPYEKKETVFSSWMRKTNRQKSKDGSVYDFDGPAGEVRALAVYLNKHNRGNKTRYASPIAEEIIKIADENRCVPSYIRALFVQLDNLLQVTKDEPND